MNKNEELLKTALKLFVEFGIHATPTSKIAKEAGVANGTLFHYYKTKNDLIIALYKHTQEHLSNYVYLNMRKEDSLETVFKIIYSKSIKWALENRAESAFMRQFSSSTFHSLIPVEDLNNHYAILIDFIQEGIKTSNLKPLAAELLQTLISSYISGIIQYLSAGEFSAAKQHEIIKDSFEILWGMIRKNNEDKLECPVSL